MEANSCLVTDYKACYDRLFGKYVKLPTFEYGNAQDEHKVCEYILSHEDERRDIVKASQKAIDEDFRFENRFAQISDLTGVSLMNRKKGSVSRINSNNFLLFKKQKTSVPVAVAPKKKIRSIVQKIIYFPIEMRVKQFESIHKKYFEESFNSVSSGFMSCRNQLNSALANVMDMLIFPAFKTYHYKLDMEVYIAKVSKGLPPKKKADQIRVVFLFQEASYWSSTESLYENLKKDSLFEVFVIAILVLTVPDLYSLELKEHQIEFLKEKGKDYIDAKQANGTFFDPFTLSPDYVFIQIHFDRQRVLEYKTSTLSLYTKVCLIPHAFLLSASDNKELMYQTHYFKVFAQNKVHAQILESLFHNKNNIEITGYPLFDLYNKKVGDSSVWKISKKENPKIKRIIWSPHWWAYGHSKSLSASVLNLWDYFYNFAKTHSDIELIVKTHPNLFNGLIRSKYISEDKNNEMINAMNALPNASIYTGENYIDLFKTANLMVNNSISFLAEWLPSTTPMIFVDTERKFELNDTAEKLLNVYYHASAISELDEEIKDILYRGNDTDINKRLALMNKLELGPSNAAERIKDILLSEV